MFPKLHNQSSFISKWFLQKTRQYHDRNIRTDGKFFSQILFDSTNSTQLSKLISIKSN